MTGSLNNLKHFLLALLLAAPIARASDEEAPAPEIQSIPDVILAPTWETQLADLGLTVDPESTTRAVMLATVQAHDPQARVMTEDAWAELQRQRAGHVYHAGARLSMSNGFPVIVASANTNLLPGDLLVDVGTQRLERLSLPAAQKLLRAASATNLAIRVIRGGETNLIDIALERAPLPAIETAELLPNQTGYLKVNGLFPDTGREIVSQFRSWSETKREGIVLDLRGAGGDCDACIVEIASLYAPGGKFLFAYRNLRNEELQSFKATESRNIELPLMILIDRETRGAAETLAAVLHHAARSSLLLGEGTAGDFNLREAVALAGQHVFMTTRVLDNGDGWRFNGQFGLTPDVALAGAEHLTHDYDPPVDLLDRRQRLPEEERDATTRIRVRGDGVLERALDILTGLKTLNPPAAAVSLPQP